MDARQIVLKNLTSDTMVYGYDAQQNELSRLLQHFFSRKEGTSVIIIGPRGSGKTMVLNKSLESVLSSSDSDTVTVIRLNGFVHTDDRLSLSEIASQLPTDLDVEVPGEVSYLESMKYIMDTMKKENNSDSSCVVFVVEEFDLLAAHHNQTLLYTLLDLTHNSHVFIPVCVIGISCRPDVVDLLEKRVRSRLSPLQIKFHNDWTLEQYTKWGEELLLVKADNSKKRKNCDEQKELEIWNKDVKKWIKSERGADYLKEKFQFNRSLGALKNSLVLLVTQIGDERPLISDIFAALDNNDYGVYFISAYDYREEILRDLSLLELCICVGIKHLCTEDLVESFNFEMVFLEFRKFQNKKNMMLNVSKSLLLKAFENLESQELIRPISDTAGKHLQKSFRLMNPQFDLRLLQRILDEPGAKFPAAVKNWYSNRL